MIKDFIVIGRDSNYANKFVLILWGQPYFRHHWERSWVDDIKNYRDKVWHNLIVENNKDVFCLTGLGEFILLIELPGLPLFFLPIFKHDNFRAKHRIDEHLSVCRCSSPPLFFPQLVLPLHAARGPSHEILSSKAATWLDNVAQKASFSNAIILWESCLI